MDTPRTSTRIWGGLQAIGGAAEAIVGGVGGIVTAETGVGAVVGWGVLTHGVDNFTAGITKVWTGEEQQTYTEKIISNTLQGAGMSQSNADYYAGWGNAYLGVAGAGNLAARVDNCAVKTINAVEAASYYTSQQIISNAPKYFPAVKLGIQTSSSGLGLSPRVQNVVDLMNKFTQQGGTIVPAQLKPYQELNLLFKDNGKIKMGLRIETQKVSPKFGGNGVTPQRHMNVDRGRYTNQLPNSGHKILE